VYQDKAKENLKVSIGPDHITVTADQVNSIPDFSRLSKTVSVQTFNFSGLALDKYSGVDNSIYTSEYIEMLNEPNISAVLYVPAGVNIEDLPNKGYAPGETLQSIWAKIMSTLYGPYLYCRFENLLPTLSAEFPQDCNTICP
jgi:hypothetical protein